MKNALKALQELDFCFYDFESEFVFVKEMARCQIDEKLKPSDNRVKGIRKDVETMPKPMRARFIARYNDDFSLGYDEEFEAEKASTLQAPSEPLRSQEQEQEQEIVVAAVAEKQKTNREPHVPFPELLPDEWRQDALNVRKDIVPERVFLKLRSRYAPTTTKKTIGMWHRIFLDWVGREFSDGKPNVPDHKNNNLRFDADYYDDAKLPDGSIDWGI